MAEALVDLGQADLNPAETAFHYHQAGASYRLLAACYDVAAGERFLHTYGFRQAIDAFDRALAVLEPAPGGSPDCVKRALLGRGLAYRSLRS